MNDAGVVQTSLCPITHNGRLRGGAGPALLCIRGIWAPRDQLNELMHVFPKLDVVIGDIPGMWTRAPVPSTLAAFSRAYDELVAQLLPNRPVVLLGVSTGAVVGLGMKSPQLRRMVVVEPFLSTGNVWPLIANMQERLITNRDAPQIEMSRRYIFDMFGYSEDSVEDRDFAPLLADLAIPTAAIVGAEPLGEPRPIANWPSFADARTRELLSAHPAVQLYEGPPGSGHNLLQSPTGLALAAQLLRHALDRAATAPPSRSPVQT